MRLPGVPLVMAYSRSRVTPLMAQRFIMMGALLAVAVEDVVLGILVGAIDAFLGKHDGHIGASYTGDIGVIVDGAAHLLLDEIQRLTLCADLLAGDGNAADSLGGALHQAVDVGLAHMPDDHDVVGAVPGGHAHAADIVLKAAGGNLGRDDRKRLGGRYRRSTWPGEGRRSASAARTHRGR